MEPDRPRMDTSFLAAACSKVSICAPMIYSRQFLRLMRAQRSLTFWPYVRYHKDLSHSDDHFYKGQGCNWRKRLRWSQDGKQRDVSAKTRSWGS